MEVFALVSVSLIVLALIAFMVFLGFASDHSQHEAEPAGSVPAADGELSANIDE